MRAFLCTVAKTYVDLPGDICSTAETSEEPKETSDIQNAPVQHKTTSVRSFMGPASYDVLFIKHFSYQSAAPYPRTSSNASAKLERVIQKQIWEIQAEVNMFTRADLFKPSKDIFGGYQSFWNGNQRNITKYLRNWKASSQCASQSETESSRKNYSTCQQ